LPRFPVGENDVDRLQEQLIGEMAMVGQVRGEKRLIDIETLREDFSSAHYLGGGLQQANRSRAHPHKTPNGASWI
jgi:hypothetical protein